MSSADSIREGRARSSILGDTVKTIDAELQKDIQTSNRPDVGRQRKVCPLRALHDEARKADEQEEPKIDWSTAVKAKPPSVDGEKYFDESSSSDSDTSSEEGEEDEGPSLTEQVQTWRTRTHAEVCNVAVEIQLEDEDEGFIMTSELPETSPPRPTAKQNFQARTPTQDYRLSPAKESSTPSESWVVSPLRSTSSKRLFSMYEHDNTSPISLAKRVRRSPIEDGKGINPELISHEDASSAYTLSPSLRHADAKLTNAEIAEIMKVVKTGADGYYHCKYFVDCKKFYSVESTLKRHLREAHSQERACCPTCNTPLSRNDKYTRERHRCRP